MLPVVVEGFLRIVEGPVAPRIGLVRAVLGTASDRGAGACAVQRVNLVTLGPKRRRGDTRSCRAVAVREWAFSGPLQSDVGIDENLCISLLLTVVLSCERLRVCSEGHFSAH